MEIDIFTLFPEAFGWFQSQRHVANALAGGLQLEYVNYRDHTPLSAGQVDDTPFGGGAGMVLRVDVVEAALRARYGGDPAELRDERRVVALTPGGRVLDEALACELAGEPALTVLSGRYEGFDERILEHFASDEVSIGRYVLARWRAARDGAVRRGDPQGARGARPRGLGNRRIVHRGARGRARIFPTSPVRPNTEDGPSPRCSYPATTRAFASGVWPRAAPAESADGIAPTRLRYHRPLARAGPA